MVETEPLCPPRAFGIVENGIYRSAIPERDNFRFLQSLSLKTVILLNREIPVKQVSVFFKSQNINMITLGINHNDLFVENTHHITDEFIKEALEIILDTQYHPILVCCSSGLHVTGTVIGCLRKLQHWSLTSILSEYLLYAGKKSRYTNEQCIELFDVDLVTLPPKKYLPDWFTMQEEMFQEEIEDFHKRCQEEGEKIFKDRDILNQRVHDNLAYEVYYYCNDGPLISAKSSFDEKKSIIVIED